MTGGVYQIRNLMSGKRYVGSAKSLARRWVQHRSALFRGKHTNAHLQAAWVKDGPAAFAFKPLLICAPKDLIGYENRCFVGFKPEYNIVPVAGSRLGTTHSPKTRERMSAAQKGRIFTPEHRANLSAACKGRTFTLEHCANLGVAAEGRTLSPEHRAILVASNRGRKRSPEHLAKLRAGLFAYFAQRRALACPT